MSDFLLNNNRNALHQNSQVSRADPLVPVPNDYGHFPADDGVEMPPSLNCLLVAGNEYLPDIVGGNPWNKSKSGSLLRFYGDNDETDDEGEFSSKSRARRLRVAKKLGITQAQLNFAQLSL